MNNYRISRRSFLAAAGIAGAAAALTACGGAASSTAASVASSAAASSQAAQSVELIVFAAASLTETLTAIGETYSAENPGVTFRFNFDSSGTCSRPRSRRARTATCSSLPRSEADGRQLDSMPYGRCREQARQAGPHGHRQPRGPAGKQGGALPCPRAIHKGIESFDQLWPSCLKSTGHPVAGHGQQRCACGPVHP